MEKRCAKLHKYRHEICIRSCAYKVPTVYILNLRSENDKVHKVENVTKLIQGLYRNHMHISRPWRKHVQSFIKIGIKLYEELRSQGTHCLWTFIESGEKVTKINSRIIFKLYAHLRTLAETCAKFQKDCIKLYEELRSQGTHSHNVSIESEVRKWQSSQSGKSNEH